MALRVNDPFFRQAVEIGRVHVVVTEGIDGVVSLLVGDNEDDIRALVAHCVEILSAKVTGSLSTFGQHQLPIQYRVSLHSPDESSA